MLLNDVMECWFIVQCTGIFLDSQLFMNWVIEGIDFNTCIILFRKLKSDKSSHQKVVQPNQAGSEKHQRDISTSKSVSASSTSAQPSISTAKTQATSSTSSQPSSQPPSHSSQPSTINSDQRNSSDHQQTSLEETSQTLREVAQSTGEVTPPASNSETSTEQQGREIEQKKRRKDKSAMRKSQLNSGQDDLEGKILIGQVWTVSDLLQIHWENKHWLCVCMFFGNGTWILTFGSLFWTLIWYRYILYTCIKNFC